LKALTLSSKHLRAHVVYLPIPKLLSHCLTIKLITFYSDYDFALGCVVEMFATALIDSLNQISLLYISLFHYNAFHSLHDIALSSFKLELAISAFFILAVYFPHPLQTIFDDNMQYRP
jgi:hypothetical protein